MSRCIKKTHQQIAIFIGLTMITSYGQPHPKKRVLRGGLGLPEALSTIEQGQRTLSEASNIDSTERTRQCNRLAMAAKDIIASTGQFNWMRVLPYILGLIKPNQRNQFIIRWNLESYSLLNQGAFQSSFFDSVTQLLEEFHRNGQTQHVTDQFGSPGNFFNVYLVHALTAHLRFDSLTGSSAEDEIDQYHENYPVYNALLHGLTQELKAIGVLPELHPLQHNVSSSIEIMGRHLRSFLEAGYLNSQLFSLLNPLGSLVSCLTILSSLQHQNPLNDSLELLDEATVDGILGNSKSLLKALEELATQNPGTAALVFINLLRVNFVEFNQPGDRYPLADELLLRQSFISHIMLEYWPNASLEARYEFIAFLANTLNINLIQFLYSYDPQQAYSVVIELHGYHQQNILQQRQSSLVSAGQEVFVVQSQGSGIPCQIVQGASIQGMLPRARGFFINEGVLPPPRPPCHSTLLSADTRAALRNGEHTGIESILSRRLENLSEDERSLIIHNLPVESSEFLYRFRLSSSELTGSRRSDRCFDLHEILKQRFSFLLTVEKITDVMKACGFNEAIRVILNRLGATSLQIQQYLFK